MFTPNSSDARKCAFAFGALLLILLIVYGNSFTGEWHFDDFPNIVDNANAHLTKLTREDVVNTFYFRGNLLRPFSYLSFALNFYAGGLDTFGYHLVNLFIHFTTSFFLFLLIFNTLKLPLLRDYFKKDAYHISLLAVVFWAVNPIQVLAVSYIVQRMTSLAGMFYISSMYFYLKGRSGKSKKIKNISFLLSILLAFFAFGSKENAAMLPFSIIMYDLFLIQGISIVTVRKNLKIVIISFLIIVTAASLYTDLSSISEGYSIRPFTLFERLLTEPRVIFFYVSLLFYPTFSRLTLLHDVDISRSIFEPWTTLPAIFFLLIAVAFALMIARKKPLISFCILFYFLNHVIEGSFLSLELIYEHRNYIPSMFLFVPLAIFLLKTLDYFAYKKIIQLMIAGVTVFVLVAQGHTVHLRNEMLKYDTMLWFDNMQKSPNLSRPYHNMGGHYVKSGMQKEAIGYFQRALEMNRYGNYVNRAATEFNLGNCYLDEGLYDIAFDYYRKSIQTRMWYGQPFSGIAEILLRRGYTDLARHFALLAMEIQPDHVQFRELLILILLKEGNIDRAGKEISKLLQQDSGRKTHLFFLAEIQYRKGRKDRAVYYLRELIKTNPQFIPAYLFLIELYDAEDDKKSLQETIASLMYLKEDKNIENVVCMDNGNIFASAHATDSKKILSIIKKNLIYQAQNIKGECQNNKRHFLK